MDEIISYTMCAVKVRNAKLRNYLQDKIPKGLGSCVVYHFKCRCCSASYMGQMVLRLHAQVSEHLGVFALTGNKSRTQNLQAFFNTLTTLVI